MTTASLADLRNRRYKSYASQHAGTGSGEAAALVYRRDIRPLLPPPAAGRVVDIGCEHADLDRLLQAHGFDAEGIDVSPEQTALAHASGITRVRQGDFRAIRAAHPAYYAAITATDVLEHFTKPEVLATFDDVAAALRPDAPFVARVPKAVSPLGGHIRDVTSRTKRRSPRVASASSRRRRASTPCSRVLSRRSRTGWPVPRVWWSGLW